VRRARHGN